MNRYLCLICAFVFLYSCNTKTSKQNDLISGEVSVINVPINYNNLIQSDSIFDSVEIIPLETRDESLLSDVSKIIIDENKDLYIQNFNKSLYIFNSEGKFLREIGNQGRGPGEFTQLAGFEIDSAKNFHILDYHKILKYDFDGNFIKSTELNLSTKRFQCWPEQFVITNNGYYIWSGSLGIKENKDNQYFAMYKLSDKTEIVEHYFLVTHKIMNSFHRFRRYGNLFNIDPVFGNDTVFSITKNGVTARYYIDFGKRKLKEKIPNEFNSLSNFKTKIASNSSFSPFNFTENSDWIYFTFSHDSKYYNAFYSKALRKTFVSKISPESFSRWIDTSWGDYMVILVDPSDIVDVLQEDSSKKWFSKIVSKDEELKERLKDISLTDNPVVFLCKMKQYSAR